MDSYIHHLTFKRFNFQLPNFKSDVWEIKFFLLDLGTFPIHNQKSVFKLFQISTFHFGLFWVGLESLACIRTLHFLRATALPQFVEKVHEKNL